MATKFYVVWRGRETGVFSDWPSCKKQIEKFSGARYKSFKTLPEAEAAFRGAAVGEPTAAGGKPAVRKKRAANSVKTYSASEIAAMPLDVMIFTDGGCEPNPGRAGSGAVVYRAGRVEELWYGLYNPQGTNNTAELNALYEALKIAEQEVGEGRKTAIFCDSKYSIQCLTHWAANWQKKGWKKPGGEIKNLALIQQMFALYQRIKATVDIYHVNGHVGVEGNELADRMSIIAVESGEREFVRYREEINIPKLLALRAC